MKGKLYFRITLLLALCFAAKGAWAEDSIRLGIMHFSSKAEGVSNRQAEAVGDVFTRVLTGVDGISVLERERLEDILEELNLSMSGLVDDETAVKVGKLKGCQYMLMGSVTGLTKSRDGFSIPILFTPLDLDLKNQKVTATLDIRVVKVETSEIVLAMSDKGSVSQSGLGLALDIGGIPVKYDESELSGLEAGAIAEAAKKLAPTLQEAITGRSGKAKRKAPLKPAKVKEEPTVPAPELKPKSEPKVKSEPKPAPAPEPEPKPTIKTSSVQEPAKPGKIAWVTKKGVDHNKATEANVIDVYPISAGDKNILGVMQRNAYQSYRKGRYKQAYEEFVKAAEVQPEVNYLSAYWAGVTAEKLKRRDDAVSWIDKALSINPDYKPAQDFKTQLEKSSAKKKKK